MSYFDSESVSKDNVNDDDDDDLKVGIEEVAVSKDPVTGKKTITMRKKGMIGRYKKFMFLLRLVCYCLHCSCWTTANIYVYMYLG